MNPPNLWINNYNFEFELARRKRIYRKAGGFYPWYCLNRSVNILLPLAQRDDLFVCYEKPSSLILERLKEKKGFLPDFLEMKGLTKETNGVIADFISWLDSNEIAKPLKLSPWGWSEAAVKLSKILNQNFKTPAEKCQISKINSKEFSANLRQNYFPAENQIPFKIIKDINVSGEDLRHHLVRFYKQHGGFFVKNFYGVSGKLRSEIDSPEMSKARLKVWLEWLALRSGLLLEKKIPIKKELSAQYNLGSGLENQPLCVTELFNQNDGSYFTTWVDKNPQNNLFDANRWVKPIIEEIIAEGYQGSLGIDFIEIDNGRQLLLEINARLTYGRIAWEWLNLQKLFLSGMFFNAFFKSSKPSSITSVLRLIAETEDQFDCGVDLINLVYFEGRVMLTLFVAGKTQEICLSAFNRIKNGILR
ncbi:MAG: hypothetical protein OEY59_04035 [Deltaproteobacteria bacterium]|nr:hypothetical protein [Deltaproteobacteria bacterium]